MTARRSTDQATTGTSAPTDGSAPADGTPAAPGAGTTAAGPGLAADRTQTQSELQSGAAPADTDGAADDQDQSHPQGIQAGISAGSGGPTPVQLMPVAAIPPAYDPSLNETVPGGRYLVDDVLVNAEGEPLDETEAQTAEQASVQADAEEQAPEPTPEARPASQRAPGA